MENLMKQDYSTYSDFQLANAYFNNLRHNADEKQEDLRNCKYGFLKRLFCKHDWEKIGFREVEDKDILYSMRHYECLKCKKDIWVDGRYDKNGNYFL